MFIKIFLGVQLIFLCWALGKLLRYIFDLKSENILRKYEIEELNLRVKNLKHKPGDD